ncbi:MAG: hypothetical protein QOE93_781 [Actinomycetota bacterium]|nr:hypothetical protein [Actinomycetota bacterium]
MDRDTPEAEVAALVDGVRRDPGRRDELVELLPERIPLYSGRGANAVVRLRGYVLAAFEQVGLPPAAVPYVLDELQNGRDAYLVAAAAMALRRLDQPTAEAVPYLLKAIENVKYRDDAVTFETYRPSWPASSSTTAMAEILTTFAWLGGEARSAAPALEALAAADGALPAPTRATLEAVLAAMRVPDVPSCCHAEVRFGAPVVRLAPARARRPDAALPAGVPLEDQDGLAVASDEFFRGRPSVVVFFYTRCDNPNKCSLTIAKLGELQRALLAEGLGGRVRTAAITYDPAFDLPARLRAYGENRGVTFGEDYRFFRATSGFDGLQEFFELGVNYGPALVNRHRIELFVLDGDGRIAATFARLQWDPAEVLAEARVLVGVGVAGPG